VVEPPLKNHGVKVSWDHDIPNWMASHKIHVPNHQPGYLFKHPVIAGLGSIWPSWLDLVLISTAGVSCFEHLQAKNCTNQGDVMAYTDYSRTNPPGPYLLDLYNLILVSANQC
jgi:hypothetical protein